MTTTKPQEPAPEEQVRGGAGTPAEPPRPPPRGEGARDQGQQRTMEKGGEGEPLSQAERWGPGDDEIAAVQRPPSDS